MNGCAEGYIHKFLDGGMDEQMACIDTRMNG